MWPNRRSLWPIRHEDRRGKKLKPADVAADGTIEGHVAHNQAEQRRVVRHQEYHGTTQLNSDAPVVRAHPLQGVNGFDNVNSDE